MRPTFRLLTQPLSVLFLATILLLSFRVLEESWAFHRQIPCPPGWASSDGSGVREALPGGSGWALRVRGDVIQKAMLLHGARQPVRISFRYRSAAPTSFAVQGDVTTRPIKELVFQDDPGLSPPKVSDANGLYRIPLPAASAWKAVGVTVRENSPDLPYMTLVLSGPEDGAAEYTSIRMSYLSTPGGPLLENADFTEMWPAAAAHPVWMDWIWSLEWSPESRWQIGGSLVGLWTPRLALLLAAAGIAFGLLSRRRRGVPLLVVTGMVWVLLSAFLTVGTGLFPSAAGAVFSSPAQKIAREFFSQIAWIIQMAALVFAGWCGGRTVGRRAWIAAPLIPFLGALMMTASSGRSPSGPVVPLQDNSFLTTGTGIVWLLTGAIATCLGALWAARQPSADADRGRAKG